MVNESAPQPVQRLEELVREYAGAVRAAVARVGGSAGRSLREDIEQRVFLEIWKQVSREQTIENPSSYIYRAAVRETVRVLKEERRKTGGVIDQGTSHGSEQGEDVATEAPNPARIAQGRELGRVIHEVIGTLAPERQHAVRGHLAGWGAQDLMRLKGWSYNRTRNLIQRGMADLRQRLLERGIHV